LDLAQSILIAAKQLSVDRYPTLDQSIKICQELGITYGTLQNTWISNNLTDVFTKKKSKPVVKRYCPCGNELPENSTRARRYCDSCLVDRKNTQRREKYHKFVAIRKQKDKAIVN
jgi:hypothetical protein